MPPLPRQPDLRSFDLFIRQKLREAIPGETDVRALYIAAERYVYLMIHLEDDPKMVELIAVMKYWKSQVRTPEPEPESESGE